MFTMAITQMALTVVWRISGVVIWIVGYFAPVPPLDKPTNEHQ